MLKEARQYSISAVQDEVRALVTRGVIGRRHKIYSLASHFSKYRWSEVESVLVDNDFLLRDPVGELIGKESWLND